MFPKRFHLAMVFGFSLIMGAAGCSSTPVDTKSEEYKKNRKLLAESVRATTAELEHDHPALIGFFRDAHGYALFPTVGEGALIFGGAHGNGEVWERGSPIGVASITEISVGLQIGGQAYTEVIFFENRGALAAFTREAFEFGAEVSAVAVTEGVSLDSGYSQGLAVFVIPKGGLMASASVKGQKFRYLSD